MTELPELPDGWEWEISRDSRPFAVSPERGEWIKAKCTSGEVRLESSRPLVCIEPSAIKSVLIANGYSFTS